MMAGADERDVRGVSGVDEQVRLRRVAAGDDLPDFPQKGKSLQVHRFHGPPCFGNQSLRQSQGLVEMALFPIAQNPDVHIGLL